MYNKIISNQPPTHGAILLNYIKCEKCIKNYTLFIPYYL